MLLLQWLNEYRAVIHLLLHVLVPFIISRLGVSYFFEIRDNKGWFFVFIILMLTMAVDIDHIVADPIYAPGRCSIWFHPLHTLWPMIVYVLMMMWPLVLKLRAGKVKITHKLVGLIGLGLVIHMLLDWIDCLWMKAC